MPGELTKLVCFYLHGQEYAAAIGVIKETLAMRPITRVFLTPSWLAGIVNLRGDVVAVAVGEEDVSHIRRLHAHAAQLPAQAAAGARPAEVHHHHPAVGPRRVDHAAPRPGRGERHRPPRLLDLGEVVGAAAEQCGEGEEQQHRSHAETRRRRESRRASPCLRVSA